MTNYQVNRLQMYGIVIDYLRNNDEILKNSPGYKEKLEFLHRHCEEIEAASSEQLEYSGRRSVMKSLHRRNLESRMVEITRKLKAYAILENDNNIFSNSNYSQWQLARMKQFDLTASAGNLFTIAQEHIGNLQPYGITPELLQNLKETLDAYNSIIAEPRMNEVSSTVATKKIAGAFREADEALYFIDLTAAIAGDSHPEFYSGYKFVRKQLKSGNVKMALKANAINKTTSEPVPNVQFTFLLTEPVKRNTKKIYKVVKKTKRLGGLKIMHMPEGKYEVVASKAGYLETKMEMVIRGSELVRIVAEMEKSGDGEKV